MSNDHEHRKANAPHDPAPSPDPVYRWATEHYGFEDAPASPSQAPSYASHPGTPTVSRRLSPRLMSGAGVLEVLVAGGVGGAAIAADGGDVHDGGDNSGVFQDDERFAGDGDDDFGGHDGGFA